MENLISNLNFESDYSIKKNLRSDLKFIFGPPGTGKTTKLATNIIRLIKESQECKILVLTPTNKACDVLTEKILDLNEGDDTWVWRFVSTMSDRLEYEEVVYPRSSDILSQKCVCVISTMARYAFDGFDDISLREMSWDYVIIDEASMVPLYQIIAPIYNENSHRIIIAGDPFQNAPIVNIEDWKAENIYTIVGLNNFAKPRTEPYQYEVETLMTQYRSIPDIGELYSQYLYNGKLQHNRKKEDHRVLTIGLKESPLSIISFPVTKDSIFDARHLMNSNIQIYSAIFTVELLKYITKNLNDNHAGEPIRIGVVSPYKAEVQAVQKLYDNSCEQYENIEVLCGTVHGFQGDECDIVIAIMNPPTSGLKRTADMTFINNKNILNVAISRARDYLIMLIPNKDYENFDSLYEVKDIGRKMTKIGCSLYTSDQIEKLMFGKQMQIENDTFVTTHQMTNVYGNPFAKYEVRIDQNALDIQVNN